MSKRYGSDAMFTAEAAIIVPFLTIVFIAAVFLLIYRYDRTLVLQDSYAILADIRSDNDGIALNEEPYLSVSGLHMAAEREGNTLSVKVTGIWSNPVWNYRSVEICSENETKLIDPVKIMHRVRDIKEKGEHTDVTDKSD